MTDSSPQSIAVFGGSFDPVHNGHVMIARSALEELELDRLIVMPAAQSPFKPDQQLAPAEARMEWLRLAFAGEPKVEISSWELDRGGVSYSIETVRALAMAHPKAEVFYLIGADRLSQELHDLSEMINTKYSQLELDYIFNDENDPNNFYTRSDHYNFANKNIPIIFYFNGTHQDYHKASDTPEKINYELLQKRTQLIFHTAWELANRKNRIQKVG